MINVWDVRKPQVECYDAVLRLATKRLNGCKRKVHWRVVLLKLQLSLLRSYKECEICRR